MTTAATGTFLDEPTPGEAGAEQSERSDTATIGETPPAAPRSRVAARRARRRRWVRRGSRRASDRSGLEPDTRASRLARRRQQQRRRTARTAAVFVVLVGLVVIIGRAVRSPSHAPTAPGGTAVAPVRADTFVLAHRGPSGDADLIAVVSAFGRRTATLFVPASALVEVPSFGVKPLGETLRLGGPALLGVTLANATAIDPGPAVALDDAQLATLLQPAGSLTVRGGTFTGGDSGAPADVTAADAARRLTDRGGVKELDHLIDAQAVLGAWYRALGQPGVLDAAVASIPPEPAPDAGTVARVLQAVAGRGAIFDTLAVEPTDVAGTEAYRVRKAPLAGAVRQALRGRLLGEHRTRVQILNGTGEVGLAQRVAAVLVPAGFEVVLTDNAPAFNYTETQIITFDRHFEARARAAQTLLHAGRLAFSRRSSNVIDLTIVVGRDFK